MPVNINMYLLFSYRYVYIFPYITIFDIGLNVKLNEIRYIIYSYNNSHLVQKRLEKLKTNNQINNNCNNIILSYI